MLLSALSLAAVAQQKKVAVYVTGEDAGINKVLGSKLVSAIARSEEYSAVERTESFLAELSREQNYQRTGAVDDSELSRLGKQFGVQYICVASVSDAFNEKYLSARLIDVESAQVERTASSSGPISSLEGLVYAANTISHDLLLNLSKDKKTDSKKVAVYVVRNDAAKNIGRVLGDKLVAGFTNSGRYIAIERTNSFLSQLSKEQNYQHSGAVDDDYISSLGRQFGVQYVCVAEVSDIFGEKYISARLIDVETAEVVNTHEVGGALNNMNSCLKMANEIASYLSKGTLKEQAEEARQKEEARIRAEQAERARIEAEEQAKQRAEEEKKRKIEEKKNELRDYFQKGYIVVEIKNEKWMVRIEPLRDISRKEVEEARHYSACGFSDWVIGNWFDFRFGGLGKVYSEMRHYLNISLPICENELYYWMWIPGLYAIPTHMEWISEVAYLDRNGAQYHATWRNGSERQNGKANALLVRKIK